MRSRVALSWIRTLASIERQSQVVRCAAAVAFPTKIVQHDHAATLASLRRPAQTIYPRRIFLFSRRVPPVGSVLETGTVYLVLQLGEVLCDFDLDLMCDQYPVNISANVRPEYGQGRHGRRDVDFKHGQDDGRRCVPAGVECGPRRRFVLDQGRETSDGAYHGPIASGQQERGLRDIKRDPVDTWLDSSTTGVSESERTGLTERLERIRKTWRHEISSVYLQMTTWTWIVAAGSRWRYRSSCSVCRERRKWRRMRPCRWRCMRTALLMYL